MSRFTRFAIVLLALAMLGVFGITAQAQVNSLPGSGSVPCQNGGWNFQLDQAPVTTTISSSASFNMPSNGGVSGTSTANNSVCAYHRA